MENNTRGCRAICDIANFQATRQTMWIQARQDPAKQWLQMCYCITEGDIDMVINEWPDEWRIPAITREVPERTTEGEAEQAETQPPEIQVPKKPRMGQGKPTQEDEGSKKTGTQKGKKETTQPTNGQQKQAEGAQETAPNPNTQESGGTKRPVAQAGGACKKSKAQRTSPDYTIIEDDGEMIARMVQDCLAEDFDHATHHRDKLQKELAEMGEFLKKFREAQIASHNRGIEPSTPQTEGRVQEEDRQTDKGILQPHTTFHINPSMLRMDEIVGQTPLKDLNQIQLVLTRIPSGALHRLQVSVNHEVQSRAHRHLIKLKQATKEQDELKVGYEKAKSETEEEREHLKGLEQKVAGTYEKIPQAMQNEEVATTEKIDRIAQAIDQYQKEIENL
jgi:hypothetical protein